MSNTPVESKTAVVDKPMQDLPSASEPPINRLPPEILSKIFVLCFPDQPCSSGSTSYAPILPARISRRWRNISFSTPELWTCFYLCLESPYPLDRIKAAELVDALGAWIGRSGSLPLCLGLYSSTFGRSVYVMRPLVEKLISHSSRCRRFALHLGQMRRSPIRPYQGYPWFRLPSRTSFPLLEEVDLDLPFRDALAFLEPAINSMPRLRDISLAGTPPSLLTVLPQSTFGQLTNLRTTSVESLQGCCEILNLSPRLRICRFDLNVEPHMPATKVPSPIVHQELDKLYVGPTDLEIFFSLVTLPRLRTLSIKANPQKGRWGQRSFVDFLHRSQCSLTKLSLFNVKITPAFLIECLEVLSKMLVELHIEGGQTKFITQSVLNTLTCRKEEQRVENPDLPCLCPLIERIRIRGHIFDDDVSGEAMITMLESRFRQPLPVNGLSRLRWAFVGGSYNENDWKRIKALESDGLKLIVVEEGEDKYVPDYLGDPTLFDCTLHFPSIKSSITSNLLLQETTDSSSLSFGAVIRS